MCVYNMCDNSYAMFNDPDDLMCRETNRHAVFTNSELSLKYTDVYGFDFDCTLVHYTSEVHRLIYELARDRLVEHNEVNLL